MKLGTVLMSVNLLMFNDKSSASSMRILVTVVTDARVVPTRAGGGKGTTFCR